MQEENGVLIERSVDLSELRWPVASIADGTDGEQFSRSFEDMRGCSWRVGLRVLEFEEEVLEQAGDNIGEVEESLSDEQKERLYPLDVGVASTVLALSAAKCYPITSCNAGPGHNEYYPLVVFRCRLARAYDILSAAEQVDCGLENGADGTLIVYSGTVRTLMRFARTLIERRDSLAKLRGGECNVQSRSRLVDARQLTLPGFSGTTQA